ncbi:MAG: hypothetical protein R3230_00350 [Nitrosopumilaceae archaeon]|nr:hypothetical protein [Nitrosopumilaceae archaeon]
MDNLDDLYDDELSHILEAWTKEHKKRVDALKESSDKLDLITKEVIRRNKKSN